MISQNDQGGLPILQVFYVRSMLMARSIRYKDVDLRAILEKGKLICLVEPVDRKVFQSRSTNNKGCLRCTQRGPRMIIRLSLAQQDCSTVRPEVDGVRKAYSNI